MITLKPIAFTIAKKPRPVYRKTDIISYYMSEGSTMLEAESQCNSLWESNSEIIVMGDLLSEDSAPTVETRVNNPEPDEIITLLKNLFDK